MWCALLVAVWCVTRAGGTRVEFDCSPRRDVSLEPGVSKRTRGAATQYIHVPKAAGTRIEIFLKQLAARQNLTYGTIETEMEPAKLCAGHHLLGGDEAPRPRAELGELVYLLSVREPLDRRVSIYSYLVWAATRPFMKLPQHAKLNQVAQALARESRKLVGSGVDRGGVLDALISRDDPTAMAVMYTLQFPFASPLPCALPCVPDALERMDGCSTALSNKRNHSVSDDDLRRVAASSLANLFRIDVLVTTEFKAFGNEVLSQFKHVFGAQAAQAPLNKMWQKIGANKWPTPHQTLSNASVAKLTSTLAFDLERTFYDVARRVATERSRKVRACAEAAANCTCAVDLSDAERDLLALAPEACVVHLPTVKGAGPAYSMS